MSPRQLLDSCICRSLKLNTSRSIEVTRIQIFRSDFRAMFLYLCKVSFLITLDLYKSYFKGCHTKGKKGEHMQKVTNALFFLKEVIASLRLRVL